VLTTADRNRALLALRRLRDEEAETALVQTGEDPGAVAREALPERLRRRERHGERQVDGTERREDVASQLERVPHAVEELEPDLVRAEPPEVVGTSSTARRLPPAHGSSTSGTVSTPA